MAGLNSGTVLSPGPVPEELLKLGIAMQHCSTSTSSHDIRPPPAGRTAQAGDAVLDLHGAPSASASATAVVVSATCSLAPTAARSSPLFPSVLL